MSKAEEFIQENTKNTYNYNSYTPSPTPWLLPDDARKAVGIAREEIIDKTLDFIIDKLYKSGYIEIIMDLCDEYIKTMKDE